MRTTLKLAAAVTAMGFAMAANDARADSFAAYAMSPAFTWSGAYVGVHGGTSTGRFGRMDAGGAGFSDFVDEAIGEAEFYAAQNNVAETVEGTAGRSRRNGANFGFHLGYNVQSGAIVWGVEGDFSVVNARTTAQRSVRAQAEEFSDNTASANARLDVNWVATARGRVGFTQDRFLGYVTAGLAFGQVRHRLNETLLLSGQWGSFTTARTASRSRTQVGYAVGAGAEVALTDNVALRGEYLYVNLGKGSLPGGSRKVESALHQARIGVNYRF